jgi:hypothetical protein
MHTKKLRLDLGARLPTGDIYICSSTVGTRTQLHGGLQDGHVFPNLIAEVDMAKVGIDDIKWNPNQVCMPISYYYYFIWTNN